MVSYSDKRQINLNTNVIYNKVIEYIKQKNWKIYSCNNDGRNALIITGFWQFGLSCGPKTWGAKIEVTIKAISNNSAQLSCKSSTRLFQVVDWGQNKKLVDEILSLF